MTATSELTRAQAADDSSVAHGGGLRCRGCGAAVEAPFLDLGVQPLANSYIAPEQLTRMEPFYPLRVFFCPACYLVQLEEFESPESIFGDYAYFSSYSTSWLEHARRYVDAVVVRFELSSASRVIEVASNDGYLLRNFVRLGIPCLGVEPARNVADVSRSAGIPTVSLFLGRETAGQIVGDGGTADLVIGNNVLAHVPDLEDFVGGLATLLAPAGVITMEFPHLLRLLDENQFDTIYHEHFSYFSLLAVERVFARQDLLVWDVDEIPTHGGSLRIYASHADSGRAPTPRIEHLREREIAAGLRDSATYDEFARRVEETKRAILAFLIQARREGKRIAGYGAPAKGNTLLNYCGIRTDFIEFTVDASPHKQGHALPGSRIPVRHPRAIAESKPDYVCILPWNLKQEIQAQMQHAVEPHGRFVVLIPSPTVLPSASPTEAAQ